MKFSATKEKLLEGLQQVQNVVSTRTTLPILSNVLLQATDGEVHLTTTDLDVGVRGAFEANVEKEGATTLPARRLFTIIRASLWRNWDLRKLLERYGTAGGSFRYLARPEQAFFPGFV